MMSEDLGGGRVEREPSGLMSLRAFDGHRAVGVGNGTTDHDGVAL
jgi:hypothetical protein